MPYGTDPRGRQMTEEERLRQRREAQYDPYLQQANTNMTRGNTQGWQDYGNIQGGYDQLMGMPQQRPPVNNTMPIQGGMTPEQAYEMASKSISPTASREEMERGLTEAYKNVPGFEQAYKESVKVNGQWYDLVNSYGADNATWGGYRPKGPDTGGGQGGMSTFGEFATTGGYSPNDIANLRARGVSPIRAAYANAERELQRGRSLQGGYSPNMAAAQVKMAREQGQSAADATQNVEAGLVQARNQGKQFGLSGLQSSLAGKAGMYGSTPGMANMFGNQALNAANQDASHGTGMFNAATNAQNLPGRMDVLNDRINTGMDWVNAGVGVYNQLRRPKKPAALPPPDYSDQYYGSKS